MLFNELKTEDDKFTYALDIAFNEISKDKQEGKDEEQTIADNENKEVRKKGYLGTHAMIKLPYVIGTPEYTRHPFAGIVYTGSLGDDIEQKELYEAERKQLEEDKANEQENLQKNAEEQAKLDEMWKQQQDYYDNLEYN